MNKKAIAILGAIFILIVGTLGFLIYSRYVAKPATPPVQLTSQQTTSTSSPVDNSNNPAPAVPTSKAAGAIKLSGQSIMFPALFYNGNGITYFDAQGNLYRADFDNSTGNLQLTNIKQFDVAARPSIAKVYWPKKGDNFIVQTATGFSFFDSSKAAYVDLPKQVGSLDWNPNGDKIYNIWQDSGKAVLNISNPDTTNWQKVSDMWELDDHISVSPDGLYIAYYQATSTGDTNKITLTTPDGKVWKDLVKDGFNYGVLWSPDSKKLLFNKKDPVNQQWQLWLYDLMSDTAKNLGLSTPLSKVTWDATGSSIYAATATANGSGQGFNSDKFYRLDVATLARTEFNAGSQLIDARDLFLSLSGDRLFFTNNQDGSLYYLDLSSTAVTP